MTRELLQKAYVALDGQWWAQNLCRQIDNALAAPQPEPYGHITTHAVTGQQFFYRYPSPPYLDTAKECIAVYAAPPAAPADMVMVPRKELGGGISLLHQAMVGACDCLTKTHEAKYHAENCFYRKLSAQCDKLEATLAAAPAPAVPRSDEFACPYCFDQGAAPAVPVSWDRLRTLMDGIPTREEFIGGQRQKYVAKEEVMGWLYECQLRAEREAAQSAAPAVREPQDERIRWRDAVIKEAEGALRVAQKEFDDAPVWANAGHAANKVAHALAVIAALGIGGGGK